MTIQDHIYQIAQSAKKASAQIACASTETKNQALLNIANLLIEKKEDIILANSKDLINAEQKNLDAPMVERLRLQEKTINSMVEGLHQIISLPDPVGEITDLAYRPSGIQVGKMSAPLGVIGMIYESRPNVTIDAAALCLKSGNACILRGGSEAFHSNMALSTLIKQGLKEAGLSENVVQIIDNTDRESVSAMLSLPEFIDVIIPRGGKELIKRIMSEAKMPVIKHLDGNCHIYVDQDADTEMAVNVILNAKTHRNGTCNTLETLLVHQDRAADFLPILKTQLEQKGVELRGCEKTVAILGKGTILATEQDWETEYLAAILAIKVLDSLDEAIEHINHYGSHHTDSIITNNYAHAQRFLREIDSSSVMINASTRFADGFEYGLGAEMGISTDKFHVRGPVGLKGLTSQKWIVLGSGQIRI